MELQAPQKRPPQQRQWWRLREKTRPVRPGSQHGPSGCLAKADRSSGWPGARSGAERRLRRARRPRSERLVSRQRVAPYRRHRVVPVERLTRARTLHAGGCRKPRQAASASASLWRCSGTADIACAPVERIKVLEAVGAVGLGAVGHPVCRLYRGARTQLGGHHAGVATVLRARVLDCIDRNRAWRRKRRGERRKTA